jgi:carboxymethylenebutenolidase
MPLIEIPVGDGTAEGWLAAPPATDHPSPGVLLYIDAFGVRPRIEEMAERIAGWGFVVLAPNVFHRSGSVADNAPTGDLRDPEVRGRAFDQGGARMSLLTRDAVVADSGAWLDALAAHGASEPMGVVGYCMGARLATWTAGAHADRIAAAAGFHGGRLATDAPDSPHLSIPGARAEFFYGHADHDQSMPPEQVDLLGRTLTDAGLTHTNVVYEGAPHGYTMSDTAMHDADAEARHWRDLEALLRRAL